MTRKKQTKQEWRVKYVIVDGPPWTITLYNLLDAPIKLYTCRSKEHASVLGQEIALDRKARFINRIAIKNLPIRR